MEIVKSHECQSGVPHILFALAMLKICVMFSTRLKTPNSLQAGQLSTNLNIEKNTPYRSMRVRWKYRNVRVNQLL